MNTEGTDLGKVGITIDSRPWSSSNFYDRLVLIKYGGEGFISIKKNVGVAPSNHPDIWMKIFEKGDKGDAFTYDDFTPEQIEVLMKPAVDAAERADKATHNTIEAINKATLATTAANDAAKNANDSVSNFETITKQANNLVDTLTQFNTDANDAEKLRDDAEKVRKSNETTRVNNESLRKSSESTRESKERSRNSAESLRVGNENSRKDAEIIRVDNEATRKANETARGTNEDTRIANETARKTAESNRVTAETKREENTQTAIDNANEVVRQLNEFNVEESGKVAAAAIVENAADITALKEIVIKLINGDLMFKKLLTKTIFMTGAEFLLVKETTPTSAPEFGGQLYVDTVAKAAYIAVGNESVSDWKTITN